MIYKLVGEDPTRAEIADKVDEIIDYLNTHEDHYNRQMRHLEAQVDNTVKEFIAESIKRNSKKEDPNGLGIGINPIMEGPNPENIPYSRKEYYVNCPDCKKPIYSSFALENYHKNCDMNKQVPDYAAHLKPGEMIEVPKWKLGDTFWFISNVSFHERGTVMAGIVMQIPSDRNPNFFKTKEQAEAALKEIRQVLEKYQ